HVGPRRRAARGPDDSHHRDPARFAARALVCAAAGRSGRRWGSGKWGGRAPAGAAGGVVGNRPRGAEPLHRRYARGAAVRTAPAGRPSQQEARLLTVPDSAAGGGRQAARVAAGILVTRVLGYVRERVFAHYFGNDSVPADAFRAALRIPNTIRSLLGEGTLLGSFIPVYAALNERADKRGARALAGAILGLLLLGSGILALLGIAFAPALTTVLAQGFDE